MGLLFLPIKKSEVYLSDNSPEFDFISAISFLTDPEGHWQKMLLQNEDLALELLCC